MGQILTPTELRRVTFQCPYCVRCKKPVDKFYTDTHPTDGTLRLVAECHGDSTHTRYFQSWELDYVHSNMAFTQGKRYVNKGRVVRTPNPRDFWQ